MIPIEFLHLCAPDIAPITIAAIVQQESGGNPFLLHDNTARKSWQPANATASAKLAYALIKSGHSVDIGLAQINSKNLPALGLSVENALVPCTNLRAAQLVLKLAWQQSGHDLRRTLAAYNTGKTDSSVGAHYSAKVFSNAGVLVPEIPGGQMAAWTKHELSWAPSRLPAIRPILTWTPAASPLNPISNGLSPCPFGIL